MTGGAYIDCVCVCLWWCERCDSVDSRWGIRCIQFEFYTPKSWCWGVPFACAACGNNLCTFWVHFRCVCVCVLVECALSSQVDDALAGCAHTNTQMPEVAEVVCVHLSHFRHLRFVCATYIDSLYSRIDWLRLWKRTYRISFNASQTEHTSVCECISAVLLLLLCLRIIIINSSWSLCGWVDKNHHFLCLVWLVG